MTDEKSQKVLLYNPGKCSGCLYCMIVCSYSHFNEISLEKAHLEVVQDPFNINSFINAHCAHCYYPYCEAACPTDPKAIYKDEETGFVLINPSLCIGCKSCNYACPLSIPHFDETLKISVKCDACKGDFLCAKYCSTGALRVVTREEALEAIKIE